MRSNALRVSLVATAMVVGVVSIFAPRAQARLVEDDRQALVAEHLFAVGTYPSMVAAEGNGWYPASDFETYRMYARSPLGPYMTGYTGDRVGFGRWTDQDIWDLISPGRAARGWAGECVFYVGLLLLRSGDINPDVWNTDQRNLVRGYPDFQDAWKPQANVYMGDIVFWPDSHAGVVLRVDGGGLWVGDANWSKPQDERIRTHFMSWQKLAAYGPWSIADLNKLIGNLRSR